MARPAMQENRSLEQAKALLSIRAIVFFEVRVEDGDDPVEVAREIARLGCSAVVDPIRRVVKVFAANPMPKGFGFL